MIHVFERLTRICATSLRSRLLLAVIICLLASAHLSAQSGLLLTSPVQGSIVFAGQPTTITWTGGDPSETINVQLVDYVAYQVVDGFGLVSNSGSTVVTIGERFCGGQPDQFGFYIENAARTNWTYGPHFTVVCQIPIGIDIKPGSFPNSVNLGSAGTVPVAILGSATLNVADIDASTLALGTAAVKTVGKTERFLCSIADVSGDFTGGLQGAPDGFPDLVCHFVTVNIVPEAGGTTAKVVGNLIGGGQVEGIDTINIVP